MTTFFHTQARAAADHFWRGCSLRLVRWCGQMKGVQVKNASCMSYRNTHVNKPDLFPCSYFNRIHADNLADALLLSLASLMSEHPVAAGKVRLLCLLCEQPDDSG